MPNKRDISFATVNLYNLQLPGKKWRHNAKLYTRKEYERKVDWTASMLKLIDADVIGFQELWSKQCLIDVFDEAKRGGLKGSYDLRFIGDKWKDIAVAAAVRAPWNIAKITTHKNFPSGFVLRKSKPRRDELDYNIQVNIGKFARTILQLSVTHESDAKVPQIEVFAGHFKSKLPMRLDAKDAKKQALRSNASTIGGALSTIRRTSEAAALRYILSQKMRKTDTPVVVLGDLNDSVLSNTLALVTMQPGYRLFEKSRKGSENDLGLYSAAILQGLGSLRNVHYSHIYGGIRETLDHILVSEQFYDHSKKRYWSFRDMQIWNDHVEDGLKHTSDHGVVRADFDYNRAWIRPTAGGSAPIDAAPLAAAWQNRFIGGHKKCPKNAGERQCRPSPSPRPRWESRASRSTGRTSATPSIPRPATR